MAVTEIENIREGVDFGWMESEEMNSDWAKLRLRSLRHSSIFKYKCRAQKRDVS
jgi:hypothetical protein